MVSSLAQNPLGHVGIDFYQNPKTIIAQRDPKSTDVYNQGTTWINTLTKTIFQTPAGGIWNTGSSTALFSSPPPIGNVTPNTGAFTTLSATGNITSGAVISSTGNITSGAAISSTGNITSGGTVTSTGNIISNGNVVYNTAGNKTVYTSIATTTAAGANSAGTVTLVAGTATIATTAVATASNIRMTRQSVGATGAAALGILSIGTITNGVSFVINAVTAADATALATTDVSVIFWEIVN